MDLKQLENKKQDLVNEFKNYFKSKLEELQKEFSFVKSFTWTQYTPYFNDGEQCVFLVNDEPLVNYVDEDGEDYYLRKNLKISYTIQRILDEWFSNENRKLYEEYTSKESYSKEDMLKYSSIIKLKEEFDDYKSNIDDETLNSYLTFLENREQIESLSDEVREDLYKKVSNIIKSVSEEDLLYVFGDHVSITITNDGIYSEHYDHE